MTLQEYVREFLVEIEQFVMYIDDAISSPDLVDFDALKTKMGQIRSHTVFIEQQIGIRRKASPGKATPGKATPGKVPHESRKNSTTSSTSTGTKSLRDHDQTVPSRTPRRAGSQSTTVRKNTGVRASTTATRT